MSRAPDHSPTARRSAAGVLALLWLGIYVLTVTLRAPSRLWYDEILTLYMARLPDLATLWRAHGVGGDLNPFFFHLVNWTLVQIAGVHEWVIRLPPAAGFFLASVCVFRFVSARLGVVYGVIALAVPSATGALRFATEARPYAMVLGLAALALVCWQQSTSRSRRGWWLVGLCLSVALALGSHAYAVLLLVPIGVGEAARALVRRRLDWPVAAALLAAAPALALYLPLTGYAGQVVFGGPLFEPTLASIGTSYDVTLGPLFWPVVCAAAIGSWSFVTHRRDGSSGGMPVYELAAAMVLLAAPMLAVLQAEGLGSAFMPRYGLIGVLGAAVVVAAAVASAARTELAGIAIAATLIAMPAAETAGRIYHAWSGVADPSARGRSAGFVTARPDLPFVSSSALQFVELERYGDVSLRDRLYYLHDLDAALRFTGSNVFELALPAHAKWLALRGRQATYREFVELHRQFIVYGPAAHPLDWLIPTLRADGALIRWLGSYPGDYGDNLLLQVTMAGRPEAP